MRWWNKPRLLQVSFRCPGHAGAQRAEERPPLKFRRTPSTDLSALGHRVPTGHGWDVSAQPMREAYAANGFEFPDDGAMALFAEMSYLGAVKR